MRAAVTPLSGRARLAVGALCVEAAASTIVTIADVASLPLLDDDTDVDALDRFDSVTGLTGLLEFLALLLTAVLFIRWFNAAHRGLDELCPGLRRHDTWWSIGGWFIPIMALFRPRQILSDMLRCANGGDSDEPWWASTWWALWIIGSFGGNIAAHLFFDADTIDGLRDATIADAISSAILVATVPLAIVVVRRTTEGLERRRGRVAAEAEPTPDGTNPFRGGAAAGPAA